MLTIKEYMELVDYRITEGSEYCMYGENTYLLSSWNGEQDGYNIDIMFDTKTQEVYCVEAYDYYNGRAYRLVNPAYNDIDHATEAWDEVKWIDLEVDDDFIQKAISIKNGEDYDTRIAVPLTLSKDDMMTLFQAAHEADMSFNDYLEELLMRYLDGQSNT
jgi:hypothetical protein